MKYKEIDKEIKAILSKERYYHSVCTAKSCADLATTYNIDIEKARLIGLAHDIAREMPEKYKIQYMEDNNIVADEIEMKRIGLLHTKIGADICKKKFRFSEDMVKAIEAHTTGKPDMDILAKILFVADSIGEDRNWNDIEELRELAKKDIDEAIIRILDIIILDNIKAKKLVHIDSIITRNRLMLQKHYN